jgi:lipopolysaccharide transport system ATP-binding protein
MAMRLAFSVIAHVDADVLIIDEALAVGDAYFQQKCLRWLRGFQKNGTVLFCSHDTGAVMSFCEQAIWLDKGNLQMIGPAKDVCEAYTTAVRAATQGISAAQSASAPKRAAGEGGRTAPRELPPPPPVTRPVIFDHLAESESYGNCDATIVEVGVSAPDGGPAPWLTGNEDLAVWMRLRVNRDIFQPIIGFHVKDRLGQPLFGDNSVTTGTQLPLELMAGSEFIARFVFTLPGLSTGRYAVTTSIASGTLDTHTQHHWVHDAIIFDVHSTQRNGVLLSVPMHEISLSPVGLAQPGPAEPAA